MATCPKRVCDRMTTLINFSREDLGQIGVKFQYLGCFSAIPARNYTLFVAKNVYIIQLLQYVMVFSCGHYLAEHGIDPDKDVQIRSVPPPEMVANLRADNIDGFLAPDPVNQRAVYDGVGFIHILSKEIWDGHPCCAFSASKEFVTTMPNTYQALLKAIIEATAYARKQENRKEIAAAIATPNYLNQPVTVLEQVLTGTYADGLGGIHKVPDRIDFDPFPWQSFAIWIMTQMKRWGQIKGDIDYQKVASEVFLATDAVRLMKEAGLTPPTTTSKKFFVMKKEFDPAKPEQYIESFAIRRG